MAYDINLAARIKTCIDPPASVTEKKMFGGIGYLVNGNMACGVHGNRLIVRTGPQRFAEDLTRPHTRPFDLTGKPMAGWLMVELEGIKTDEELKYWIERGLEFARTLPIK